MTHTLRRHLVMWEQAISRSLINDPATFYAEHNVEGLLRGDSLKHTQFYDYVVKGKQMLHSEVRQLGSLPTPWRISMKERLIPLNNAAQQRLRAQVLAEEPLCRDCAARSLACDRC